MKNKKLLSILTTIAVVAGCLPGFVCADNDVVDAETNTEVTEETNSAEEPQSESYEVDESIASVSPAYANDTPESNNTEIEYIYRTWDRTDQCVIETVVTTSDYRPLSDGISGSVVAPGVYYVSEDLTLDIRLYVMDQTVSIILADGVTLTCNGGIGVDSDATLNIYGQSNDSGSLIANASVECAGIGSSIDVPAGIINIYGGTITAEGASGRAGIGGNYSYDCTAINIYGGSVTAKASFGNNIGSTNCSVNFYGGTITLPVTGGPAHVGGTVSLPNMCVCNESGKYYTLAELSVLTIGGNNNILTVCPCQHSRFTDGVCDYCGFEVGDNAQFIGHAMRLTGEIGLQFYVQLPENANADDYYMTFVGQGMDPSNHIGLTLDSGKSGVERAYYATVSLSSIQMAETFTPTLHGPNGFEIQGTPYSAQNYIVWGKSNTSIGTQAQDIIRALGDYGYFAQRYFSSLRSWTLGTDYAAMTVRGSDENYSLRYDEFREWINNHSSRGRFETNDYFSAANISLKFDSLVTLYVYLTPKEGVTIDASSIDAAGGEVTQLSDGRFMISYPALPITALDHTISINYSNSPIAQLSPLSYVYTMLGSDSVSADGKNMVCSLFRLFGLVVYPNTQ